jgi:starch synthase/alpha-amylase
MKAVNRKPRILVVTPEIAYFPKGMWGGSTSLSAKAGGLADVSAALIEALFEQGADVHVALPDYRLLFNRHLPEDHHRNLHNLQRQLPMERVHLAADRAFYYLHGVYFGAGWEKVKVSLAFQREVINNIIPRIKPDLVHCNDWVTGLIPAAARRMEIPCLFTLHNIHTVHCPLVEMEDRGIDAAEFWQDLYFEHPPGSYEATRRSNAVDLLTSGVFAAHFVNTVSPSFLQEVAQGRHTFVPAALQQELANKVAADCAVGILNAPHPSYDPEVDHSLHRRYRTASPLSAKTENKMALQKRLGLAVAPQAPLFFWPSRLDPVQKGCPLLADVLYELVSRYWEKSLQVVFVADGEFQEPFRNIVAFHGLHDRVAVCAFDEGLARLAYGAADFVLMPSLYEPCGLPQMIGALYGTLPVAHKTGGIQDTVEHLSADGETGNGFLFETYDTGGLVWAVDEAMRFFDLPEPRRDRTVARIMADSRQRFNHPVTARHYIALYEKMLQRPLITAA